MRGWIMGEPTLTLRYRQTPETRVLPVIYAEVHWKLRIVWGHLAGQYLYDCQKGVLLAGRRELPWNDAFPPAARRLWFAMRYPGKQLPELPFDPCLEEAVKRQGAA